MSLPFSEAEYIVRDNDTDPKKNTTGALLCASNTFQSSERGFWNLAAGIYAHSASRALVQLVTDVQ